MSAASNFRFCPQQARIGAVAAAVAAAHAISVEALMSRSQAAAVCRPRQVAWLIARFSCSAPPSVSAIGRAFNRDHASVNSGLRRIGELARRDAELRAEIARIEQTLRQTGVADAEASWTQVYGWMSPRARGSALAPVLASPVRPFVAGAPILCKSDRLRRAFLEDAGWLRLAELQDCCGLKGDALRAALAALIAAGDVETQSTHLGERPGSKVTLFRRTRRRPA